MVPLWFRLPLFADLHRSCVEGLAGWLLVEPLHCGGVLPTPEHRDRLRRYVGQLSGEEPTVWVPPPAGELRQPGFALGAHEPLSCEV